MFDLPKQILKRLARSCGYRITQIDNIRFFDFEALLYFQLARSPEFRFIQIGACDGVSFDPIYPFVTRNHARIRGLVVEPLPDLFGQLQHNYRKFPSIVPVNCAIHNTEKEMILYRVDPARTDGLPEWSKGLASFNNQHHELTGIPRDVIVSERVACMSLPELMAAYQYPRLDLLQIDTEGYDAEIILGIDYRALAPTIIRFEHGLHVRTMTSETVERVADKLHQHGYELAIENSDAIAYQRNIVFDWQQKSARNV